MNKDYMIYRAPEDEIPGEDKARYDGYTKAFEDAKKALEDSLAAMKATAEDAKPDS